jgi:hypothetical protein
MRTRNACWLFRAFFPGILVVFMSCQAARSIRMINETGTEAKVIFSIKEDSIHSSPFFISNEKETTFLVYPGKKGIINFTCGIGNWSPESLKSVADDLESIVLRSDKGETRLSTEEEIIAFLKERRKGMDKGRVEIRFTD